MVADGICKFDLSEALYYISNHQIKLVVIGEH